MFTDVLRQPDRRVVSAAADGEPPDGGDGAQAGARHQAHHLHPAAGARPAAVPAVPTLPRPAPALTAAPPPQLCDHLFIVITYCMVYSRVNR